LSLEFNKLIEQVQTMGRYLGKRSQNAASRLQIALDLFFAATDMDAIHERIKLVRDSSVSGYRGAAPLPRPYSELICGVGPAPAPLNSGTIVAADGSQIYPDPHSPTPYYLINTGVFTYYCGEPRLPTQSTTPELFYSDSALHDKDGRMVNNQTVNARRSVAEMEALARQAWHERGDARPLVAFHDGTLLKFFGATDVAGSQDLERDYIEALVKLRDVNALLAGYVDRPRSTSLIAMLHLMSLPPDQVNDANLKTNGEIEGLVDEMLFAEVLEPGERSAMMVQNSPQNREYKDRAGEDFEIAFFYVNVSDSSHPVIARIDLPMWVARDPDTVDELHTLILAQCAIQGRRRYPYALTRADELAYVSSLEKQQVDQLIRIEMLNNGVSPEATNKLQTKGLARGEKRQHRLRVG
jgi:hypothetical protein